ncbi:Amino acid/metabolite permease [Neorhizobium galegae bv. orientalis str. HAMBI 540]|uniref:Amino acid/metabolite permease n=2 Tax=Neorhizobium galegae TaxID=399 RepID=A0A068SRD5_NEOGA|nr:Amino acid/metabolite permease [Neorhizobium galegae bv. orientalis str. HAMBI 540]
MAAMARSFCQQGEVMSDYTEGDKKQDIHILHSMGYAQELERRMSSFSNFAISFSIICILSGGINSLAQATSGVGGAAIGIGWPIGCIISLFFALGMAQISSAYPTAGGLYHWSSILGTRFTGWLTAWLNLLGLITVLGAINIGTALFLGGTFGAQLGIADTTGVVSPGMQVVLVILFTIVQAAINHFGIGLTAKLTDFSGTLILVTAAVLTIACLIYAPTHDISRLWTFTNYSGDAGGAVWPQSDSMWYIFALGLLLPIYTITGYDASAHTSEETKKAALSVPRSMVSAVLWSSLAGWVMLSAFVIAIPDMAAGAKQGWAVFFTTINTIMPAWLVTVLYVAIFISQFLCGLATVTSCSRMIFAFSRDGGIPVGSKTLASVSPKFRTPVAAIWTGAALESLFVWGALFISVGEASLYVTVVNATLIFLFLSFLFPIVLGIFAYGTKKWPAPGPWDLGQGVYKTVGVLATLGMVLIIYIAIQPPNDKVLAVTVGLIVLAIIIWFAVENKRFKGPPIGDMIAKRKAEIAAAEAAVGETGTVSPVPGE